MIDEELALESRGIGLRIAQELVEGRLTLQAQARSLRALEEIAKA
ncbi:MAG TPA: hypothetical protein VLA37_07075 [Sphingomonadaceae bacterium]|nr:hypothetical protein [Sphingomonadaceae bacterium]